MARGTPKRANREARPGALFPSEAVARNIRAYRAIRVMTQADLAALMNGLGLEWSDGTVGFVERGDRAVTVDEYVGLALCVGVTVGALLDPTGPAGLGDFALDLSGIPVADASPHGVHLPAVEASRWARGAATVRYDGADSFIIQATSDERGVR